MNLQQLEYFKVIAGTKTITAASNKLSISQPALSKAISKLEEELGVALFERDGRTIKITNYGEVFLKYAETALDDIARGIEKIEEMKQQKNLDICIAATNCIGVTYIPFLISEFLTKHGYAKFNFKTASPEELCLELKNKSIQVAFLDQQEEAAKYPELQTVLVKKEEYVLIVSKNHSLANREEVELSELKEEYFIAYDHKNHQEKISYQELFGYTPKVSVQPSEITMLAGLVAAGAGIAIVLNTPLINTNKISIIKIKDDIGYKSIYMAWNKEVELTKYSKVFQDYVMSLETTNSYSY
ncbi:MAG: LysR family transcriptional regulator [bacterium]|nr:LysR family transcriptional regulator [bacterium]